jgi:hypothetical protein
VQTACITRGTGVYHLVLPQGMSTNVARRLPVVSTKSTAPPSMSHRKAHSADGGSAAAVVAAPSSSSTTGEAAAAAAEAAASHCEAYTSDSDTDSHTFLTKRKRVAVSWGLMNSSLKKRGRLKASVIMNKTECSRSAAFKAVNRLSNYPEGGEFNEMSKVRHHKSVLTTITSLSEHLIDLPHEDIVSRFSVNGHADVVESLLADRNNAAKNRRKRAARMMSNHMQHYEMGREAMNTLLCVLYSPAAVGEFMRSVFKDKDEDPAHVLVLRFGCAFVVLMSDSRYMKRFSMEWFMRIGDHTSAFVWMNIKDVCWDRLRETSRVSKLAAMTHHSATGGGGAGESAAATAAAAAESEDTQQEPMQSLGGEPANENVTTSKVEALAKVTMSTMGGIHMLNYLCGLCTKLSKSVGESQFSYVQPPTKIKVPSRLHSQEWCLQQEEFAFKFAVFARRSRASSLGASSTPGGCDASVAGSCTPADTFEDDDDEHERQLWEQSYEEEDTYEQSLQEERCGDSMDEEEGGDRENCLQEHGGAQPSTAVAVDCLVDDDDAVSLSKSEDKVGGCIAAAQDMVARLHLRLDCCLAKKEASDRAEAGQREAAAAAAAKAGEGPAVPLAQALGIEEEEGSQCFGFDEDDLLQDSSRSSNMQFGYGGSGCTFYHDTVHSSEHAVVEQDDVHDHKDECAWSQDSSSSSSARSTKAVETVPVTA